MPVRSLHEQQPDSIYFITFTCYNWLPLFQLMNAYDTVYNWFDYLYTKNIRTTGYVIMPNHLHVLLYFRQMPRSLNTIIGNGKRFMAYEIIKRLTSANEEAMLNKLAGAVKEKERTKGQLHKVFEDSFDAKECISTKFIYQKLDYIHHNPTRGKWMLAADFLHSEHSSAAFYEDGKNGYSKLLRVEEIM